MSQELATVLQRFATRRAAEKLQHGWSSMPPWVFCNRSGHPLDESRVRKHFAQALQRSGLPGFRLYDLRHTYATLLLAQGTPITYVSAQLGHAKPVTTLQWYAHWIPRTDRRYVDALDTPVSAGWHQSGTISINVDMEGAEAALKKAKPPEVSGGAMQATHRIRTDDLLITNQLLYRLS